MFSRSKYLNYFSEIVKEVKIDLKISAKWKVRSFVLQKMPKALKHRSLLHKQWKTTSGTNFATDKNLCRLKRSEMKRLTNE